jgi:hypothetical protein
MLNLTYTGAKMIQRDAVKKIIADGKTDISGIAAALIQSGYKHPTEEADATKERVSPFTRDLEICLKNMCDEGIIQAEIVEGKNQYTVKE